MSHLIGQGAISQSTQYDIDGFGLVTSADPNGATIGILAGYNWVVDDRLFGLELDVNYTSAKDSGTGFIPVSFETTAFASLHARMGIIKDNILLYTSLGATYFHATHQATAFGAVFDVDNSGITASLGAGMEIALKQRFTLRLDFKHFSNFTTNHEREQIGNSVLSTHSIVTSSNAVRLALIRYF